MCDINNCADDLIRRGARLLHSITSDSPDGQPWPPRLTEALFGQWSDALMAARFGAQ
jgi:hypothetical protein